MRFPLGIQSFQEIIDGGYIYIDKTANIKQLIDQGKWYFLSRPRRFGKSLLVSTIQALFEAKEPLFKGLAITQSDYAFEKHPILKFDFSQAEIRNSDDFRLYAEKVIDQTAAHYGVTLSGDRYDFKLVDLVRMLAQKEGKKVVLLVDEYDKPILNTLESPELADIRGVMGTFYAAIKSLDDFLKFVLITGVSKFAKVSVFSGMNNLNDISGDRKYATICGYTKQEVVASFDPAVVALSKVEGLSVDETYDKIAEWYNGYAFSEDAEGVYNPFSMLSLFVKEKFQNYWYQTATPTFLLNLLKSRQTDLSKLEHFEVGEGAFHAVEPDQFDVLAVLLQTGYLTIKEYEAPLYKLGFPNKEVKIAFYESLAASYASVTTSLTQAFAVKMHRSLNSGNIADFIEQLKSFIANVSYEITLKNEKYYQSLFFVICKLLGFNAEAEVTTNKGRIDLVLDTDNTIYMVEFKLNGTKEQAIQQIKDMQYPQKYSQQGKEVILLGVEFSESERNISGWLQETHPA